MPIQIVDSGLVILVIRFMDYDGVKSLACLWLGILTRSFLADLRAMSEVVPKLDNKKSTFKLSDG
jgi:hypothetical protein